MSLLPGKYEGRKGVAVLMKIQTLQQFPLEKSILLPVVLESPTCWRREPKTD